MKSRSMAVFYALWVVMCLLSFITSTALGFVIVCLGVMIRLLELNLESARRILGEQRALKTELRAFRISLPDPAQSEPLEQDPEHRTP
jgi:hypothetical protein